MHAESLLGMIGELFATHKPSVTSMVLSQGCPVWGQTRRIWLEACCFCGSRSGESHCQSSCPWSLQHPGDQQVEGASSRCPASLSGHTGRGCPGSLVPRSRRPWLTAPQHLFLRLVHGTSPLLQAVPSAQLLGEDVKARWQQECLQSHHQAGPRRTGTCQRGRGTCAAA